MHVNVFKGMYIHISGKSLYGMHLISSLWACAQCCSSSFDGQLLWDPGLLNLSTMYENGSFGRSLMLMSRPGIRLQAINRELMRLVVCLGAVVTHLKDGLCPEPQGSVIDPSRGILPRLYSPFSKMQFRLSKIILYWGNFIIHKMQCLDIGDDVYLCWEGGDDALTQTGQCGNTKGWMQGEWWGCSCAATCQAWEPVCVYSRETVPIQNNERALPLLNNKKAILLLPPPPKGHRVRDRESTQKPPVCRQSGLAERGAKAEVIINRAVPG